MSNNGFTSTQVEEIMTALTIAGRSHADGAGGAGVHGVVMVLVGLDVGPEFEAHVVLESNIVALE